MSFDTKTFQNVQPNTQLSEERSRTPINQALQYLSGVLQSSISSHVSMAISVHEAGSLHASKPTFHAHKNGSNQASISATSTPVTFGTESWDTGSYFATNTYTPPAGKYRLSVQLFFTGSNAVDNESLTLELFKNGGQIHRTVIPRAGTGPLCVLATWLVDANGTDAYSVMAIKGGAGVGTLSGAVTDTWFSGEALA